MRPSGRPYAHPVRLGVALGLVLAVGWPQGLCAQSAAPGGLGRIEQSLTDLKVPVDISADEMAYSRERDELTASGRVRLTQGTLTLEADQAVLHRASGHLIATGGIKAGDGTDQLEGETLDLDLNTRSGVLTRGRLFLPRDHYRVTGERIERLPDQRYRLDRATITTCDCDESKGERPAWRVRARRLTIQPEQYLTARGVVFDVKNVPVAYLPYLVWPVKTERQTGLLQPHVGYSTSEGWKIWQPLYLTLGPSQDATVTLDHRTVRGTGGTLEYRYRLSRRSQGKIEAELFHDRIANATRRRVSTEQAIDFNDRLQLRVQGQYVSDDAVLRDLQSSLIDRTKRTIESNLFLTYHDPYQTMTLLARYTQDLDTPVDEDTHLLPALDYRLVNARGWNAPLFVSIQGSAANFWKRTGFSTQRVDLFPMLVWRQEAPFGLILTPRVGVRETVYSKDALGGDPVKRELGVAGLGIADSARREWNRLNGGRLIHAIEPAVLYTYVGMRGDENLPRFDEVDDVSEQQFITASVINRVIAASPVQGEGGASEPDLEALWVRLTQSYRVRPRADPVSGIVPPTWSAVRGEATWRTGSALQFDVDALYDHWRRTFTTVDVDARLAWAPYWDFSVGHRSTSDADPAAVPPRALTRRGDLLDPLSLGGIATAQRDAIDFYIVGTQVHLPMGITLANKTYRNRQTNAYTEIDYGLQYNGQCWSVTFTYQDLPEKNEFSVLLTLVGAASFDSKMASGLFESPSTAPH